MDLGLVTGEVAIEPFAAESGLSIAAAMYSTAGMFVVRGDSPARWIADLKGQPVAFGARGSGLVILARYVLDGLGLDMERDFTAIYLDRAGDGPDMVLDGRAAALWGGGVGWPGFARVAEAGGRFIAPDAGEAAHIRAKHAFLKPLTVPAGAYPGQDAAIAFGRLVVVHPGAARPARRHRLPPCPRAAPGRRRGSPTSSTRQRRRPPPTPPPRRPTRR